jgi:hypothetical protein
MTRTCAVFALLVALISAASAGAAGTINSVGFQCTNDPQYHVFFHSFAHAPSAVAQADATAVAQNVCAQYNGAPVNAKVSFFDGSSVAVSTGGLDGAEDPPHDGDGLFLSTSGYFGGQGFTAEFTVNDGLGLSTSTGSPAYASEIQSTTTGGSPITTGKLTINGVTKSLGNLPTSSVSLYATRHNGTAGVVSLFDTDSRRRQKLSPLIDRINTRYGRGAIGFGLLPPTVWAFSGHAAFRRVPEGWEF